MADKQSFTTTIEKEVQNKFKAKCAEQGIQMNDVLTVFMKMYADDEFNLVLDLSDEKRIARSSVMTEEGEKLIEELIKKFKDYK